jgi:hypothetical protein
MSDNVHDLDAWTPIKTFVEKYPDHHENEIRWLIRNKDQNGFDDVVRKIGRRWFLNRHRFARWILRKTA